MEAVRRGRTFVTYGPLLGFAVDGHPMGSRIQMPSNGGTVDVSWQVASATIPMSRVDLIMNGESHKSVVVSPYEGSGSWSVRMDKSSWLALLVRGHYPDKPEIIAAHSSAVMISVEDSPRLALADAATILDQIEGVLLYLDTVSIRAEGSAYDRMRAVLTSASQTLHDRMRDVGHDRDHTLATHQQEDRAGAHGTQADDITKRSDLAAKQSAAHCECDGQLASKPDGPQNTHAK